MNVEVNLAFMGKSEIRCLDVGCDELSNHAEFHSFAIKSHIMSLLVSESKCSNYVKKLTLKIFKKKRKETRSRKSSNVIK